VLSHESQLKNELYIANNVMKRFFLHETKTFQKFITKKKNFWVKTKNTCFMILNEKQNFQISMILMNPCPIYVKRSE
jgi:hypothetical protein